MVTLTLTCRHCGSDDLIRFGYTRAGGQRLRCRACGRTHCLQPRSRAAAPARKAQILAACQERASMRGVARLFGVSRNTLASWLKKSQIAAAPAPDAGGASAGGLP